MEAFRLFPPELWEEILLKVEDPQAKLNIIGSNTSLERFFYKEKIEWQLAAILPIVMRYFEKRYEDVQWLSPDHSNDNDELWWIRRSLVKCADVSRATFKAVDKYVRDYWNKDKFELGRCTAACNEPLMIPRILEQVMEESKFYPPEKPPVVSRSVIWSFDDVPPEAEDLCVQAKKSTQFLEKYGHHLLNLTMLLSYFPNHTSISRSLPRFLQLVPNLRSLNYWHPHPSTIYADDEIIPEKVALPSLPHLKHLIVNIGANLPAYICFKPYFPQLTHLIIELKFWREEYNEEGLFPNLKYFTLHFNISRYDDEMELKLIKLFRKFDCPQLKQICLKIKARPIFDAAESLIEFLEKIIKLFLSKQASMKDWKSLSEKVNYLEHIHRWEIWFHEKNEIVNKPSVVEKFQPQPVMYEDDHDLNGDYNEVDFNPEDNDNVEPEPNDILQ